jgi:hypothetical protein
MPKILINEVDNTSAGTPGRYGNYSVLITGYKGSPAADETKRQKPDENGVYEFSSAQAFKDTIREADVERKDDAGNIIEYHYGNKMAYELLKLGYQVIYKVIDKVADMADFDECWAIFKDKASYDFRFISHGLLKTCYDTIKAEFTENYKRLAEIDEALSILAEIKAKAEQDFEADSTSVGKLTVLERCAAYFDDITGDTGFTDSKGNVIKNYKFLDNAGRAYSSYALAAGADLTGDGIPDCEDVEDYIKTLTDGSETGTFTECLYHDRILIQNNIKSDNDKYFTIDEFNQINGHIASLASYRMDKDATTVLNGGRGDCIALIELDEDTYYGTGLTGRPEAHIIKGINSLSTEIRDNGAYCALTVPSVYYANGMKMPGAFHYLACFMSSLSSGFAEWYAAAGYTRGVSSYAVEHTSVKLGEIAINALEPRYNVQEPNRVQPKFACNVIANFRGSYYLWGNRTAALLGEGEANDLTANHFLNIRQLCTTIKKQLYVACRRFTFDPNSDTLWFNFVNAITPTLDAMKADQGIRDYKVVKVFTDKKATLKARIRIIPIEAVEDFDITVSLEDSFGGVSVTAEG